jgi:cytochrome c-type biogenesis protein CcmH
MSGFIVIAGLLTLATLVALLYPLLRKKDGSPESWRSAGVSGLLILLGGAALYPVWSNYKWHLEEPAADSPQAMVGRLARRLEREPDDLAGWLMLGRSYRVIQQYELAARAYQRADTLAGGKNADALMGLAESLLDAGRGDLSGRPGRLFEQAMQVDPTSVKALFYSAFAARERNELPLARERFAMLLTANPPEAVQRIILEQIQEIDVLSRMTAQAPGGEGAPAAGSAQDAGDAAPVSVPVRITLSPSVAGKAEAGAPLFVVARVPGQRGPPLAAQRLEARFPQDVDLLSTDAMLSGSGFSAGQELEIEARIANGGGAISRSGDPFGVVRVRAGDSQRAAIEINQLKP